jgi:tetratricopeptide (TPR) repeat protein
MSCASQTRSKQAGGQMVEFLTQPEIEAVLLTALLGLTGWACVEWWKARRRSKAGDKKEEITPPPQVPQVTVNIANISQATSPRHQLPPPPANFTGRDEELDTLEKALVTKHATGATISGKHAGVQGMGGVGKSALAVMLAHRLKHLCPDAQIFVNLRGADPEHRPPVTPAEAMRNIIQVFHPEAKPPEELDQLKTIYCGALNEAGRVLLLLDNAADENQVRPLLPPANCLLLVTSRKQFSLPGLEQRNLDCLLPEKSQEFLCKLSKRFKPDSAEVRTAAELCGHLPLKLEVFGSAVENHKVYSVPDMLELLRTKKHGLTPEDAAFQVSYELLAEELRRQWMLLAVFLASFDLRAAAAVWEVKEGSSREAMQALFNANLVEYNEASGRYRLHDLVRQFCIGKLTEADRTAACLRHAAHYRDVGDEADQLYQKGGENVLRGLELFDRERVHIEAAFEFLEPLTRPAATLSPSDGERDGMRGTISLLLSLVNAVVYTSDLRFHPRQSIRWLEAQRDAARLVNDRKQEGDALGNLGLVYKNFGDIRKAIEFYEQSLVIEREIGDRRGEGNTLGNLGNAYRRLGDKRKAVEFHEQALVVSREIGDRRGEGADLGSLGNAYLELRDVHKSIEFYKQALAINREIGDRRGEGNALGNLGIAYRQLGDARKAIEFHEQALVIDREIGDRRGEGNDFGNLGIAYFSLGDARKAIEFHEQALVIDREIGDRRGEGNALWNSALALDKLGERAQAIARAEAALKIHETIEDSNAAKVRAKLAEWRGQK